MQYLKKSFNKLKNNDKLSAINELIKNLNGIRDDINHNSNGNILPSYIGFEEDMKEQLDDLKEECKLTYQYSNKEIEEMKQEIKEIQEKIKIYNEIENIIVKKKEDFEPNEGWNTTTKSIKIEMFLKDNINLEFNFQYEHNAYDDSKEYTKNFNGNIIFYIEDGKYYNGKRIKKNVNTLNNFQKRLQQHCKDNNIDFEKFSEKELSKLMKDNLKDSKKLKKEIDDHQKNKNTPWTFLVNTILEKFNDEDDFINFFDQLN